MVLKPITEEMVKGAIQDAVNFYRSIHGGVISDFFALVYFQQRLQMIERANRVLSETECRKILIQVGATENEDRKTWNSPPSVPISPITIEEVEDELIEKAVRNAAELYKRLIFDKLPPLDTIRRCVEENPNDPNFCRWDGKGFFNFSMFHHTVSSMECLNRPVARQDAEEILSKTKYAVRISKMYYKACLPD